MENNTLCKDVGDELTILLFWFTKKLQIQY